LANVLENSDFWQDFSNSAPSGTLCTVAYCMHCDLWTLDSRPVVTKLQTENEVGKFATLANSKHCDVTVSQTTYGRWLLETEAPP